jgi:hypothetical protein
VTPGVYRKLSVSRPDHRDDLEDRRNQRYSWLKIRRSLLVKVATAAQVQLLIAHQSTVGSAATYGAGAVPELLNRS